MGFAFVYSLGFIYLMSIFAETLAKGLIFVIVGGLWMATLGSGYMYSHPATPVPGIQTTDVDGN